MNQMNIYLLLVLIFFASIAGFYFFYQTAKRNAKLTKKTKELENAILDLKVKDKKLIEVSQNTDKLAKDLEKFKLALDNTSDHIIITDPEGTLIYGNKAVEKITGYTLEEALGKKAGVLWGTKMPQEYYKNFWHVIKEQKKTFSGEIQNRRKNGQLYTAVINVSPVLDKNGEILFFVGIERDITKEKDLDRQKDEFISLASHQLRSPIVAISWSLETLLDGDKGPLNQEQKILLEKIYKSDKNMLELVGGFLDISKIESGGFNIEKGDADLIQISDSILEEIENQIVTKKIKLLKKYDENIPHLNIGAKTARIILQNLFTNAVKYTPEKGIVEIIIKKNNEGVSISVKDNGYGIPDKDKNFIFTKLFRANNVKQKEPLGTGLGLYLLKTLVDKLGGKVWFESEEGSGTTFYVDLK